ncbi:hypothetical protein M3T53_03300 [Actinomyces sp. B33]|uniref:hypothetical protein n=1 Tax=Actinomyces sp. B33 TaxID=2942131 RepID=UPI002341854A|nr:hypothetical protein [Actinomyces sp. B33]MDC4232743.1 hypothetical protein [Actinomyces sp. B33]
MTENIVQTIARDILTHPMHTLEQAGYKIVMHVHDEVVIDHPKSSGVTVDELCELMATVSEWAAGLPLDADVFECSYYRKD